MSYVRNRQPLSGAAETAYTTAQAAAAVATDPALAEVACRFMQLSALENGTRMPTCPVTPSTARGGIGLRKVAPAMRAYVYAEQHPWTKPAAVAAVLGVPFLLGYLAGRR